MSGIPVYTSSPINAAKASGVTPQTQTVPSQTAPTGPTPAATPTSSVSPYPAAQPGAAAMSAPTGSSQRYAPAQPTPTTTMSDTAGPPPPQPGAVPTAPYQKLPPPPKAGDKYVPPPQPYPPQMAIPSPTSAYGAHPPASSTSTTTAPSSAYPVPLSSAERGGVRGIEHPPGYHQNIYASELNSDQRRANESSNSGSSSEGPGGVDSESALNTAKQWLLAAGNKLSEAEQEVWRRINKE